MRTKHRKLDDNNYWPGYVDALVNVVLNMLFMVGIMAVGLVCLNMQALTQLTRVNQAQQLYQISEENMLLAALGTFIKAIPEVPPVVSPPLPVVKPPVAKAEPVPSTLRVTRSQPLPSLGDEKKLMADRQQWPAQTLAHVVDFEPFNYQVSASQSQSIRQFLTSVQGGRWSLSVAVDGDERSVREAFWRLTQVRQELLAAGIAQSSITLRTVNMLSPSTGSSRRVYLAHLPQS